MSYIDISPGLMRLLAVVVAAVLAVSHKAVSNDQRVGGSCEPQSGISMVQRSRTLSPIQIVENVATNSANPDESVIHDLTTSSATPAPSPLDSEAAEADAGVGDVHDLTSHSATPASSPVASDAAEADAGGHASDRNKIKEVESHSGHDDGLVGDALEPTKGHDSKEGAGHGAETEHHQDGYVALLFFFGALFTGSLLLIIIEKFMPSLPYTCGLFAIGMLSSIVHEFTPHDSMAYWTTWFHAVDMWEKINPHMLFFAFLPPLLFSEAMRINVKLAATCLPQILLLACPGVLFGTAVTGAVAKYILPYGWDWPICLVFGSILSATDPVAVVALFNTLGVSPRLTMVISGESLLNDGTAIVIFTLMLKVLLGATLTSVGVTIFFSRMVLLSIIVGLGVSVVAIAVIDLCSEMHSHSSAMIQVITTLCCAYLAFFVAEAEAESSGVLATVAAGSGLAYYAWPLFASREIVLTVWEAIEFIGNTIIFFLAGMLFMNVVIERHTFIQGRDLLWLFGLYAILHVVRALMVALLWVPLNMVGSPLDWKEGVVMVWSGLRGAVSLTMAIIVDIEPAVSKQMGSRVLFHVGGIAALTCLINATSAAALLKKLGLANASSMKERMLSQFTKHITEDVKKAFDKFLTSEDIRFNGANRSIVCGMVPVLNGHDTGRKLGGKDLLDKCKKKQPPTPLRGGANGATAMEDVNSLAQTYREVFLRIVQSQYWEAIDEGVIPRNLKSTRILLHSIDAAFEQTQNALADWSAIERAVSVSRSSGMTRFLADLAEVWPFSFVPSFRRTYSREFATMQIVYSGLSFIDAHYHAMEEMKKYFGAEGGNLDLYVQDMIAVESLDQCQRAAALLEGLDKSWLELGRSEMLAQRLLNFQIREVEEAKEHGLLSVNEAADFEHELYEAQVHISYSTKAKYIPNSIATATSALF